MSRWRPAGVHLIIALVTGLSLGMIITHVLQLNSAGGAACPCPCSWSAPNEGEGGTRIDSADPSSGVDSGGSPVGASNVSRGAGAPAAPSPGGPPLSLDSLLAHAQSLDSRIRATTDAIAGQECGVGHSDAVALLTVMDLLKVDVVLESGTGAGRSAELMARFFQGGGVQIATVDIADQKLGGRCATKAAGAMKHLRAFPNVDARIGDSGSLLPALLRANRGKRVGLFIDGPKGLPAIALCMRMLKLSDDVQVCVFHDVLPPATGRKTESETYDFLQTWGRTVATTCCADEWLRRFGLQYGKNSSMGIVAGTALIPFGTPGYFDSDVFERLRKVDQWVKKR